ncbi:hypothetical protein CYY_009426 [Polysphondylium violaceum]|uniref:COP9 signalosome complex subunit 8 n=1 Tax=Polysphondylium violaceum TaxID=133409 RepID=A0A8J4UPH6_9MYCE|nr:hypothetical protein CYY_009426 [Polysphondylium violaceum]
MSFKDIQDKINNKDFDGILKYCQDIECESSEKIASLYGAYLFCYLIKNDITNARFLWKRIPSQLRSNESLKSIWTLAKSIHQFDTKTIYTLLGSFGAEYQPFVVFFKESFQNRTFNLISNAYTSISLSDCINYLGISQEQTIELAKSKGWTFDESSKTFTPLAIPTTQSNLPQTDKQLQNLTNYVLFLEKSH